MLGRELDVGEAGADLQAALPERAAAFVRLADGELASMYRLAALLLGSEPEGQDAVQDAAVRAWERFDSLHDPERFPAWFRRILVNGCRDRLRRRGRVRWIGLDPALVAGAPDFASRLAEHDALRRGVGALTADQRTVIVLRYYADLPLEEIARLTGARPGTVKSRLHHALDALHAAYDAADRLPVEGTR